MTSLVHGHNDILMALFTSLAVYLAVTGRWLPVIPALVAATLVKHLAGPVLPFAFLLLGRRCGWKKAALSAALGALLGVVLSLPYLGEGRQFQLGRGLETLTELHNSPAALLHFPFEVWAKLFPSLALSRSLVVGAIKLLFWAVFLAFYARLAWLRLRGGARSPATLLRDCVLLQFVLVCLISPKFYPWYVGMFLPLALWLPEGDWLRRAALAVSCAQLLSLTFVNQAHFLNVLVMLVLPLGLALRRPRSDDRPTLYGAGGAPLVRRAASRPGQVTRPPLTTSLPPAGTSG
jgi:hypothetical protein